MCAWRSTRSAAPDEDRYARDHGLGAVPLPGLLDAAIDGYTGPVLVVAKSLGTLAAARSAALGHPAAWLTPLLTQPIAAEPLMTYPAPQFVAIGSMDPYLDRTVFDRPPGERVEVAGDHILKIPDDVAGMVSSHEQVIHALDTWLHSVVRSI